MDRRLRDKKYFCHLSCFSFHSLSWYHWQLWPCAVSEQSRSPTCTSLCFLMEGATPRHSQMASSLYHKLSKSLSKCSQDVLVFSSCLVRFLQSLTGLRPCVFMKMLTIIFSLPLSSLWARSPISVLISSFHWTWHSTEEVWGSSGFAHR